MLVQQLVNGIVIGSCYALFALGFTLVFGISRVLNLAHGAVLTAGAFAGLYAITAVGLPLWLAFVAAVLTGGGVASLLEVVAFRPLRRRGASEFAPVISSIGAGLVLTSIAQRVSHTQVLRFPFGTFPVVVWRIAGLRIQLLQVVIVLTVALLTTGLLLLLYRTRLGRQIRAVAISETTSELLGIAAGRVFVAAFFLSGALAGAAGVLLGLAFNSVHFLMGEPLLLRGLIVVVLGGLGSLTGAVCAGLLLGVVQALSVAYLGTGQADALLFVILFGVLVLRPTGLLGGAEVARRVARA